MKKSLKNAIKKAMEYAEDSGFDYEISFSSRKMAVLFFNQNEPMCFYFGELYTGEVFENNPAYFSDLDEFLKTLIYTRRVRKTNNQKAGETRFFLFAALAGVVTRFGFRRAIIPATRQNA